MGMGRTRGSAVVFAVAVSIAMASGLSLAASASGAPPELLTRITAADGVPGHEAGEVNVSLGLAANSGNGHVYVSDAINARISEYTAWGLFVRAWGWDVAPEGAPGDTPADELETCGPAEPEESPPPGLCQMGSKGSGSGQFSLAVGVAVDLAGNVYVSDQDNLRIQKFSPTGKFLLMFGGDVNKTKVDEGAPEAERNRCPIDPADVCQAGSPGEGPSHLAGVFTDTISYNRDNDTIVVGDRDRIQIFDLDGTYNVHARAGQLRKS